MITIKEIDNWALEKIDQDFLPNLWQDLFVSLVAKSEKDAAKNYLKTPSFVFPSQGTDHFPSAFLHHGCLFVKDSAFLQTDKALSSPQDIQQALVKLEKQANGLEEKVVLNSVKQLLSFITMSPKKHYPIEEILKALIQNTYKGMDGLPTLTKEEFRQKVSSLETSRNKIFFESITPEENMKDFSEFVEKSLNKIFKKEEATISSFSFFEKQPNPFVPSKIKNTWQPLCSVLSSFANAEFLDDAIVGIEHHLNDPLSRIVVSHKIKEVFSKPVPQGRTPEDVIKRREIQEEETNDLKDFMCSVMPLVREASVSGLVDILSGIPLVEGPDKKYLTPAELLVQSKHTQEDLSLRNLEGLLSVLLKEARKDDWKEKINHLVQEMVDHQTKVSPEFMGTIIKHHPEMVELFTPLFSKEMEEKLRKDIIKKPYLGSKKLIDHLNKNKEENVVLFPKSKKTF